MNLNGRAQHSLGLLLSHTGFVSHKHHPAQCPGPKLALGYRKVESPSTSQVKVCGWIMSVQWLWGSSGVLYGRPKPSMLCMPSKLNCATPWSPACSKEANIGYLIPACPHLHHRHQHRACPAERRRRDGWRSVDALSGWRCTARGHDARLGATHTRQLPATLHGPHLE